MTNDPIGEGWYLMSIADLEIELARLRDPDNSASSNARRLSVEEALEFRDSGNIPDELDRSLRLVLEVRSDVELRALHVKRLDYEPDFHEAPTWRVEGSKPVNVVPVRTSEIAMGDASAWWDDPRMAELEDEWSRDGTVAGVAVPGDLRSFVYKTVVALRDAGKAVTVQTISDSIARWLPAEQASAIHESLSRANRL